MKERPILFSAAMVRALLDGTKTQTRRVMRARDLVRDSDGERVPCPYGVPGDRLWVKEAIRHVGGGCSEYIADGALTVADAWPWKPKALPGMFCPRGLSRITLAVTDVRVHRLQQIDEFDSLAEGIPAVPRCGCDVCRMTSGMCTADAGEQVRQYAELWDHINGKRAGCSWDDNPWVWAITFRRPQP